MAMPDNVNVTVTLPKADWSVIRAGLWKLPMETAYQVVMRLEQALVAAEQPPRHVPGTIEDVIAGANGGRHQPITDVDP